jgi:hypothetical protein
MSQLASGEPSKFQRLKKAWTSLSFLIPQHRVGRVLSFFSSRRNWDSPIPHPQARRVCPPPPIGSVGEGHTRLRESGVGVLIPTRGHTLWYSLYVCTLRSTAGIAGRSPEHNVQGLCVPPGGEVEVTLGQLQAKLPGNRESDPPIQNVLGART